MNRTHQTLKNSFWGLISKIISIFSPFIIRTLIINELGANYLGLSGLFTSILQVLNMAELGISSAIVFSLYRPLAEKDRDTICALMALYRKLYRYIGFGILGMGICVTPFLSSIIKSDVPNGINIYILFLLYLLNTSVSYLLYAYKSALLTADQRSDIMSKVYMIIMLFQYILQIIMLIVVRNYYIYYIITPICTCLYNLYLSHVVDKMYPTYKPVGNLSNYSIQDLKQRIKGVLIGKICIVSRNAISSILLSAMMGLVTVAIYTNYFLIITSLSSFTTVFITAMSASVGNSMTTESEEKNHNDFQKFTFIYAWITGVLSVCLLCMYQPFMKLWVGDKLMLPEEIVIAFTLHYFLQTSGDIKSVYMNAKGLWWENRWRTILESVSNIVFSWLFIYWFGVIGAVIGPMISLLIFNFGMSTSIMYKYCFPHFRMSYFFKQYLVYFIATALSGGLASLLIKGYEPYLASTWISMLSAGLVSLLTVNIIYVLVYQNFQVYSKAKLLSLHLIKKNEYKN